jgi:hypothetical protein
MTPMDEMMTGKKMMISTCRSFAAFLIAALVLSSCGDSRLRPLENDAGEVDAAEAERDWYESQDTIVMPWVNVLDEATVADVQEKTEDAVVFSGDSAAVAADYEYGDILISAYEDMPFMRRVIETEAEGATTRVITENASLTQVFYKASFNTSQAMGSLEPREQGLRRQALDTEPLNGQRGDKIDYWAMEYSPIDQTGFEFQNTSFGELTLTGSPVLNVKSKFYFSIAMGAGDYLTPQEEGWDYEGTSACVQENGTADNNPDCVKGETCTPGGTIGYTCHFEPLNYSGGLRDYPNKVDDYNDLKSCGGIIKAMEFGEANCSDWKEWYESRGTQPRENYKCTDEGWVYDVDYYPPFPAQISWAKDNCSSLVEHLEVDIRNSASAGIKDLDLTFTDEYADTAELYNKSVGNKGIWFWVGFVPIYINVDLNFLLALDFSANFNFNLNLPGVTGIDEYPLPSGGYHMYGSDSDWDEGHFGEELDGFKPGLQEHEMPSGNDDYFRIPELETHFSASAELKLRAEPRLSVLLYDMAGPYIEPFNGFFALKGQVGEGLSCNFGAYAGFKSVVGFRLQLPFGIGDGEDFETEFYDSCGGSEQMCPAGLDGGCWRTCWSNNCDGTTDPDPDPEPEGPRFVHLQVVGDPEHNPGGKNDPSGYELDSLFVRRGPGAGTTIIKPVALYDLGSSTEFDDAEKLTKENYDAHRFTCQPNWVVSSSCEVDGVVARTNCDSPGDSSLVCYDSSENGTIDECGRYAFNLGSGVARFSNEILVEFEEPLKQGDRIRLERPEDSQYGEMTGGPTPGDMVPCEASGGVRVGLADSAESGASRFAHATQDSKGFSDSAYIYIEECLGWSDEPLHSEPYDKLCIPKN